MSSEPISVKAWLEKHSFDDKDSFVFLKGKTLDGQVIRSLNTKVSETALDSYKNDVRAVQKKTPNMPPLKKIEKLALNGINKLALMGQQLEAAITKTQTAAKQIVINSKHKLISTTDTDIHKQQMDSERKPIHAQVRQMKNKSPLQFIKHCIKCNEELEIDAQFCSECGTKQT
jgi:ribosomal protein L40E